jgi:hypothetical protein
MKAILDACGRTRSFCALSVAAGRAIVNRGSVLLVCALLAMLACMRDAIHVFALLRTLQQEQDPALELVD